MSFDNRTSFNGKNKEESVRKKKEWRKQDTRTDMT
jgi:hypothetical protein